VVVVEKPVQAAKTAKAALANCLAPQVNKSVTANAAISKLIPNTVADAQKPALRGKSVQTEIAKYLVRPN